MNPELDVAGVKYVLEDDRLKVLHGSHILLDICLSPVLDGRFIEVSRWEKIGHNHFKASLGEYGKAFLAVVLGRVAYWVETPVKQFERVTYLSDGIIGGNHWRTFVSDEHEGLWPKKIDQNIPISSAYADSASPDGLSDGGITDPNDTPVHWIWNVHVRAWALEGDHRWLGLSIPGPWGLGVTRLNMQKEKFNLKFEVLRPACSDGKMPIIYFCPNLSNPLDVLDEHRMISEQLGLMDLREKQIPQWWTNPWQGYYDEWERHRNEGLFDADEDDIFRYYKKWIEKTRETTGVHDFNINFEQGCYRLYGDYRPSGNMGSEEELRAKLDALRKDGIRSGLYIHPFLVNTKVPFCRECPDAFCRPKNPDYQMAYPLEFHDKDNPKFMPVDWTHPKGREFMLDWVEYILSDKPGCLNFDILRSNHWRSPDPRVYNFHDPDWGIGDMMTYNVQKLLYDKAKQVKPDCLVTKIACADCYMQPTFDMMEIAEDWTPSMAHWYRRTQIVTHLLRNSLLYTDPWFVTRTNWSEFYMGYLAVNIPECQGATHTTHPYYPSWKPLAEKHFRRRKTGYQLYLHARPRPSDEMLLNWENGRMSAYRKRTDGPLAGWYATLAIDARCLISYCESSALVGASQTSTELIPIPPEAEVKKVLRVLHDGHEEEYEYVFDYETNTVRLYVEDCGKDVLYYRIDYRSYNEKPKNITERK